MRTTLSIIAVSLMLISCGGAGPAKSALSSALRNLETARSTNCVHESLELAEKSYTKAQQLFDEEKYDDAEKEARVADQLAAEAHKATNGVPCPLEKPKVKVIKEVPADIQQETQMKRCLKIDLSVAFQQEKECQYDTHQSRLYTV